MPDDSPLELSKLDSWRGLRPGITRAEVRAVLVAAGLGPDGDASDDESLDIYDWEMELRFTAGDTGRLRQISLDGADAHWAGQPLVGVPLGTALHTLGAAADGARWRPESPFDLADLGPPKPGPLSDEILLGNGTVWLPALRIGLGLCDGLVNEVVWRDAPDLPREMIGTVTEAQRQLSLRPDLAAHLRQDWSRRCNAARPPADPRYYALLAAVLLALAYIGWLSLQETRRWSHATLLTGQVLTIETLPGRQRQKSYRVAYLDPTARRPHETSLVDRDFYISPATIGQEVHLYYSNDDPPRILGETRVRDAAFIRYMPWAIGVGCVFAVGRLALAFLPRKKQAPVPGDGIIR